MWRFTVHLKPLSYLAVLSENIKKKISPGRYIGKYFFISYKVGNTCEINNIEEKVSIHSHILILFLVLFVQLDGGSISRTVEVRTY